MGRTLCVSLTAELRQRISAAVEFHHEEAERKFDVFHLKRGSRKRIDKGSCKRTVFGIADCLAIHYDLPFRPLEPCIRTSRSMAHRFCLASCLLFLYPQLAHGIPPELQSLGRFPLAAGMGRVGTRAAVQAASTRCLGPMRYAHDTIYRHEH